MKMKKIAASCIATLALTVSGAVFAQSCGSPLGFNTPAAAPVATGNTCTGANNLGTLCGLFNSPENDDVYQFTIGGTHTSTSITLTTTSSTFNPAIALLSATCGGGTSCTDVADSNTVSAGGATSGEVLATGSLAAGTYFMVVSASPGTGTCGDYNLASNGTLPVELQKFSVE